MCDKPSSVLFPINVHDLPKRVYKFIEMTLVKSSLIVNSGQVRSGQFRSLTKIASGHSKLRSVQVMT